MAVGRPHADKGVTQGIFPLEAGVLSNGTACSMLALIHTALAGEVSRS